MLNVCVCVGICGGEHGVLALIGSMGRWQTPDKVTQPLPTSLRNVVARRSQEQREYSDAKSIRVALENDRREWMWR